MKVLCVLSTVSLGKRVDLDPEGDALLSAVFPGSELCADAVHLQTAGIQDDKCYQNMCLMWKFSDALNRWHKRELIQNVCVCGLC